jgi:putative transport protein
MIEWFFATLRQYPEIAIFLALGLGYYFGGFTFKGIGLGSVTATLLAAVIIGQIGITISTPLKATVFLMFLFAVGYGSGPSSSAAWPKTACRRRSSRWCSASSAWPFQS